MNNFPSMTEGQQQNPSTFNTWMYFVKICELEEETVF